jgi:hypothetical protein
LASSQHAVRGQHYDLDRIWLCLSCLLTAKVPLQAVPRLVDVFEDCYHLRGGNDQAGPGLAVPHWTTSRMWLMRLGLAQLRQARVKADDWVWLVDHSVQLGRDRCLVVLGTRLSELPAGRLRLCRQDMQSLHLAVMSDPNQYSNHRELLKVQAVTGSPRLLLSDHAADLAGAVRLFLAGLGRSANTLDIYDVTHKAALVLQWHLEKDPRWAEFLSQVGKTRNQLKQTEWAFLLPPVLRTKSRYLNLGELMRWASRTSWLVHQRPEALLEHGELDRLEEKMGWLRGYATELTRWQQCYAVTAKAEEVVRDGGLHQGAAQTLRQALAGQAEEGPAKAIAQQMVAFVAGQSKKLKPGEKVPGSTEVLESCFGTLKALEKDQSRSGFTGLVLGLGGLVGKVTREVVARALESTPVKAVRNWCQQNIGMSLQRKRRQVYRLAKAGATVLV